MLIYSSIRPCGQIQQSGYLLQPDHSDAIDVFDKSALLELRRAAHLQLVFKTSFSRLNPGSRGQATIISNPSEAHKRQQRTTRATGFLPTSSPSPGSGRLGPHKDHQNWARTSRQSIGLLKYLEASRSIFSSQCMQNRHQASARCKLLFLQKTTAEPQMWPKAQGRRDRQRPKAALVQRRPIMVELNGIEPLTPCLQSRCSPS